MVSFQGQERAASPWEPPRGGCIPGPFPAVQDRPRRDAQQRAQLPRSAGGRTGGRERARGGPRPSRPRPPGASTHPGRASPARRRSCPGWHRARPAARAAGRTAGCAPRARRRPRRSPPPRRPWLGRQRPRAGRWRDAGPRPLHAREGPLHNRGNPPPRLRPRLPNTPNPGPGRGGPCMTQSAAPLGCPRGRPVWPWGLRASAGSWSAALSFEEFFFSFLWGWDVTEDTAESASWRKTRSAEGMERLPVLA